MYNFTGHIDSNEKLSTTTGLEKPALLNNNLNGGAGVGGSVHIGLFGINVHYDMVNQTTSACIRFGLGFFLGGGVETYGYGTYGQSPSQEYITGGIGGDLMFGAYGLSGGVNGNPDTIAGTMGTRYGVGIGGSVGIDGCSNW